MSTPIYELLADAFHAEGTKAHFTLMGDGNMHWTAALAQRGVRTIYVRHENCACSMALSYALATGEVGLASVTCGPGLTQTMTALTTAAYARIPLVVFAGESPVHAAFYNQRVDQAPFVTACGGVYISGQSTKRMHQYVREAFLIARTERRPVVLGVPYDMQKQKLEDVPAYVPSTAVMPRTGRAQPAPEDVARAVAMIRESKRVVVLAGRGALWADAAAECMVLADRCGGMLSTTLPVRGLFDESPFSIGIAGGFAPQIARELFGESDLVVCVGASVTHHTADGGSLFPNARVLQIDRNPIGIRHGRKVADLYVEADAKAGLAAILETLDVPATQPGWRTPKLARRIVEEPADPTPFPVEPGTIDPRDAVVALDRVIPKDWEMVNSSGHCSYFAAQMRGRRAENFHVIREFGAIGNGLSYAIGVAVARPDRPVVLIDGDGGFLMHAQELETIRRHGLKILICVLNDGGFGSEFHKLRSDGVDVVGAVHGRGDLGATARGFGLRGAVVNDIEQLGPLLEGFVAADTSEVWDIHISDQVISPPMRKLIKAAH